VSEPDIEKLREIVQRAFWEIIYHEDALVKEHQKVALTKGMLDRAGFKFDGEKGNPDLEDEEEDDRKDVESYARYLWRSALSSVAYHEDQLKVAHRDVATAKALVLRAGLGEEISFSEAEKWAKDRLEQREQ
jgi:hypothetical protein